MSRFEALCSAANKKDHLEQLRRLLENNSDAVFGVEEQRFAAWVIEQYQGYKIGIIRLFLETFTAAKVTIDHIDPHTHLGLIHIAAMAKGGAPIVEYLLKQGANIELSSPHGTPLFCAIEAFDSGHVLDDQTISLLIRQRAKTEIECQMATDVIFTASKESTNLHTPLDYRGGFSEWHRSLQEPEFNTDIKAHEEKTTATIQKALNHILLSFNIKFSNKKNKQDSHYQKKYYMRIIALLLKQNADFDKTNLAKFPDLTKIELSQLHRTQKLTPEEYRILNVLAWCADHNYISSSDHLLAATHILEHFAQHKLNPSLISRIITVLITEKNIHALGGHSCYRWTLKSLPYLRVLYQISENHDFVMAALQKLKQEMGYSEKNDTKQHAHERKHQENAISADFNQFEQYLREKDEQLLNVGWGNLNKLFFDILDYLNNHPYQSDKNNTKQRNNYTIRINYIMQLIFLKNKCELIFGDELAFSQALTELAKHNAKIVSTLSRSTNFEDLLKKLAEVLEKIKFHAWELADDLDGYKEASATMRKTSSSSSPIITSANQEATKENQSEQKTPAPASSMQYSK